MKITLINTTRTSLTSVDATFQIENELFTVCYHCINESNGRIDENIDIDCVVKSNNQDLSSRVHKAIIKGENDENADIELYLYLRDIFTYSDFIDIETDIDKLNLVNTDIQLFVYEKELEDYKAKEELEYSVNYAINDLFMVQYDNKGGFSIPNSNEAQWSNSIIQDIAANTIDADELAEYLSLDTELLKIAESATDVIGNNVAKELLKKKLDKQGEY